jgi:hypothetical protein
MLASLRKPEYAFFVWSFKKTVITLCLARLYDALFFSSDASITILVEGSLSIKIIPLPLRLVLLRWAGPISGFNRCH